MKFILSLFACFCLASQALAVHRLPLPLAVQVKSPHLVTEPITSPYDFVRIVGGVPAVEGEAPHQIALLKNGGMWCGGSLIGPNVALTAAHCVYGSENRPSIFKVRYSTLDNTKGLELGVSKIIRHPGYSSSTIDNDLALLILSAPFTPSATARVIELADSTPADGTRVTVTGWGRLSAGGTYPTKLQKADTLEILNRDQCAKTWAAGGGTITNTMLCAKSATQSSCNADSGGPLTVNGVLHGVVSWGSSSCLHATYPNVYVNVAVLKNWITSNTY